MALEIVEETASERRRHRPRIVPPQPDLEKQDASQSRNINVLGMDREIQPGGS